jgi:hypothetical protein
MCGYKLTLLAKAKTGKQDSVVIEWSWKHYLYNMSSTQNESLTIDCAATSMPPWIKPMDLLHTTDGAIYIIKKKKNQLSFMI